jgi:hypothetical protein
VSSVTKGEEQLAETTAAMMANAQRVMAGGN